MLNKQFECEKEHTNTHVWTANNISIKKHLHWSLNNVAMYMMITTVNLYVIISLLWARLLRSAGYINLGSVRIGIRFAHTLT